AGVVGGISATAGINIGEGIRVYEAFHGGSREQIGVNRANPPPLLFPALDLLESARQKERAARGQAGGEAGAGARPGGAPGPGGTGTTAEMAGAIMGGLPPA